MNFNKEMLRRPRRNRKTEALRTLVAETALSPGDLVAPFFIFEGRERKEAIHAMPGIFRLSCDLIIKEAEYLHSRGVQAIALFPAIPQEAKDHNGKEALNPTGIIPKAIRLLKKEIPTLCVICDIALDPYTSHGHDGVVDNAGYIANDPTVSILAAMALLYAEAGVDIVAPSDMMDGRIGAIRRSLDEKSYTEVGILSYCAKYASALYSPFREALGSKLHFGDKKTYQMDPANVREALLEASLDVDEGADMLMVKPALFYLDVIAAMRTATLLPLSAYHVSGEYAMVMAAHQLGFMDANKVFFEALLSIKRAGADFIFTYATRQVIDSFFA